MTSRPAAHRGLISLLTRAALGLSLLLASSSCVGEPGAAAGIPGLSHLDGKDTLADVSTRPASGAVTGRVLDAAGKPLARVPMSIQAVDGSDVIVPLYLSYTDRDGEFLLGALQEGNYRVQPDTDLEHFLHQEVHVVTGQTSRMSVFRATKD